MKCLLCSLTFADEKQLFEHYKSFHKIDKSNWFFKFNIKNSKELRKCLRCEISFMRKNQKQSTIS